MLYSAHTHADGSSLALYMHRFLENSLAPAFAKRVLGTSAWSQIIVGGSNFGEVIGPFPLRYNPNIELVCLIAFGRCLGSCSF